MADTNRLGDFLRARRGLGQPVDVHPGDRTRRRVQGMRREEVAVLAGLSVDYYVRLEQGRDRHPSPSVLRALAGVLDLDDDALAHLHRLAAPAPPRRTSRAPSERVGPGLLRLLEHWSGTPAFVHNRFRDVLACTALAAALHPGLRDEPNTVRLLFLDPEERRMHPDWEKAARDSLAWLRAAAGDDLDDPRLAELVGELAAQDDDFARMWSRHDVQTKSSGRKQLVHPVVGELTVEYETFAVHSAPGQSLTVYHAEPGSRSADALVLLAGHAAGTAPACPTDARPRVVVLTG